MNDFLAALRQYWYLALMLVAAIIVTLWVMTKAAQASRRTHAAREAQMKKLEYETGVMKEFSSLSVEKLKGADKKRAFDGVAMNIQKNLEKRSDMDAAFSELSDAQKKIYALYYLADDSRNGLSEFFKCNSAPLTPVALSAARGLLPADALAAFEAEYHAYDPENEDASLVADEIASWDEKYAEAMKDFDFYGTCVDMIIKNLTDFS